MKKKLIAVALVTILLVVALTGCTLFVTNEERDYDQTLATLSYEGMTANITKGEFIDYFAQNATMYIQQAGMAVSDVIDLFMNSLAKREILLMHAKKYYAGIKGMDAAKEQSYDLLDKDEQAWVVNRTNKQFSNTVDAEIKKLVNDSKAGIEEDEDALAARKQKPEEDEFSEYKKDAITDIEKFYFEAFEADKDNKTELEMKAFEKVKKQLKDSRKDFGFYLEQQADARLLIKFKEDKQKDVKITDEEILSKYNMTLNSQELSNITDSAYKAALDGGEALVYHKGQYVKVKSILLKFSATQEAYLKSLKAIYPGSETSAETYNIVAELREALVNGTVEDAELLHKALAIDNKNVGLRVNISNPDYDPDAECKDKECECKTCLNNPDNKDVDNVDIKACEIDREQVDEDGFLVEVDGCKCVGCINNAYTKYNVPFVKVLDMINEAVNEAERSAGAEYEEEYGNVDDGGIGKKLFTIQKRIEAFEDMLYLVNDDAGMFEGKDYTATPEGKASDYVPEYTALIRAMMESQATGSMIAGTDSYLLDGKTIDIVTHNTNYQIEEASFSSSLSYIINDFGIHIVMLTSYPVDEHINSEGQITSKTVIENGKEETYYTLGLDAIIGFDDETGKAITVRSSIEKSLEESKKAIVYSNWERDWFKDKYGDKILEHGDVKVDNGVFKQVRDTIGKLTGTKL